ncbi:MAG: DUF3726 domain-containing protein [Rubellimicrobium sp.]|nr:DUF3726 domain-containing protein [Rubellimicrobium sp.]
MTNSSDARSLNEIEALVLKAARGAGLPLGHAEDIAAAAPLLAAAAPGDLDQLVAALAPPHDPVTLPEADPILLHAPRIAMAGPLILDRLMAEGGSACLRTPDAPALMIALARAAAPAGQIATRTDGTYLHLTMTPDQPPPGPPTLAGPVPVPPRIWASLESLAARTLVPESEASRRSGAGAGLSDND